MDEFKVIKNVSIYFNSNGVQKIVNDSGIVINRYMCIQGSMHPRIECEIYKPNGTGPENNKKLKRIIETLPSSDDFYIGSCFHDWMYLFGKDFTNRKTADKIMCWINKFEIRRHKSWWQSKYFIYVSAPLYYRAVRIGGNSSFYKG